MNDFLQRLKQRKLVQWAVAYLAAAWVVLQVLDLVSGSYHWPDAVMHIAFGVLAFGLVVMLVLAWYHGERGAQRASGMELLIVALILAIGGGLLWHFSRTPSTARTAPVMATARASRPAGHSAATTSAGKRIAGPARAASTARRTAPPIAAQPIPAKSVAVLPFENLSADKNNAYFADGMQDLILTKLADIGDLKVIARTATEKYTSQPDDLQSIGRQLGVATFLEGSVQKAGNQVLINVQLIDAKSDAHIWAQSYQRKLDNIFGVEGEVADKVAKALNAKLTASETTAVARVPTTNPQAYDDYLRALHFENEAEKGDWATFVPQAITAAEKAVAEDPDFALAWAELSNARIDNFYWAGDRSKANLRAAEAAAKRALALAPKLPEAHLAMAGIERFVHHDLVATRNQDQQAVDLRPNDADALGDLAIADANLGDAQAAAKALRRAAALDPTDEFTQRSLGLSLAGAGKFVAARQAERRALAINPQFVLAYLALSRIDIAQNGDVAAATKVLDHMAPGTPVNARVVIARIHLLLYQRNFAAARTLAKKYAGKFTTGRAAIDMTSAHANIAWLAGNTDQAHALYRTAIGLRTHAGTARNGGQLGLAYARLGEADAARTANAAAAALLRRLHNPSWLRVFKYVQAQAQLALGRKSAAIATLVQFATLKAHGARIDVGAPPALLRIDPVWDPIRNDPRFQALLKQYASHKPAGSTTTMGTSVRDASIGTAAPASATTT